ncbi:MAG: hypothetical protein KDD45_05305 [Bdellovibrionales bacterium]|nr:hypothetical protein [Bdellovibrionales bacterium]
MGLIIWNENLFVKFIIKNIFVEKDQKDINQTLTQIQKSFKWLTTANNVNKDSIISIENLIKIKSPYESMAKTIIKNEQKESFLFFIKRNPSYLIKILGLVFILILVIIKIKKRP